MKKFIGLILAIFFLGCSNPNSDSPTQTTADETIKSTKVTRYVVINEDGNDELFFFFWDYMGKTFFYSGKSSEFDDSTTPTQTTMKPMQILQIGSYKVIAQDEEDFFLEEETVEQTSEPDIEGNQISDPDPSPEPGPAPSDFGWGPDDQGSDSDSGSDDGGDSDDGGSDGGGDGGDGG